MSDVASMNGHICTCAECGADLKIVCPNGHENADVAYRLAGEKGKRQEIDGICTVTGCDKARAPRARFGVGRPPTKCEGHLKRRVPLA